MIMSGEITEIEGRPSSGRTSLLVACLADVTRRGTPAALIDTEQAFDPVAAARAGVDLRRLLWVRCGGRRDLALRATDLLVRCPGFALVALDLGERPPRVPLTVAFRLRLTVHRTGTALLIMARRRIAGPSAALALRAVRCGLDWVGPGAVPTRLARVETTVEVLRGRGRLHALVPPGSTWWWAA
jgi:recombination protein RecA